MEKLAQRIIKWVGSTSSLIAHTIFFLAVIGIRVLGVTTTDVLLILTTVVSLEAIYLAIFAQMTLNKHTESLKEVQSEVEDLANE